MGSLGGDRQIREGDIVVTAVAEHYAIGRKLAANHLLEFLESHSARVDALQAACQLAGSRHRVFLYSHGGRADFDPVNCDVRDLTLKARTHTGPPCPGCQSSKTIQTDEQSDEPMGFCAACQHLWLIESIQPQAKTKAPPTNR